MAIAFARSLRSLEADGRSRGGLWFIVIAAVVLAAWMTWFLRARVAQYERTDRAVVEAAPGGRWLAVATFPVSALGRIRAGQPARVFVQGSALTATVAAVSSDNASRVVLNLEGTPVLRNGLQARIEVTVDNLTPAALLLRTAGQGQ